MGHATTYFFLRKFLLLLFPSHEGKELAESTAEDRWVSTGRGEPDVKVLQCENLLCFSPSHSSQRADISRYTGLLLSEALGRACLLELKYILSLILPSYLWSVLHFFGRPLSGITAVLIRNCYLPVYIMTFACLELHRRHFTKAVE